MGIFVLIIGIAITYWLIKGWVKVVNFLFKKIEKTDQEKTNIIRVKSSRSTHNLLSEKKEIPKSNTIALTIDSIIKRENYFDININLKNIGTKPVFYELGECYFASENGLQVQGDTLRLLSKTLENTDRILPTLYVSRRISFYNKFSDFSENDTIICEVLVNNVSHLVTSNLLNSNIKVVELAEMV
ncbi:hypothetical protein [Tenacibaculum sp. 190524A02b]|uniref:hypothetical protein n=1 Tax=Tenacibaculum vairaonense TaxID=3137860 RepID=UPI0031FAF3CC